MVYNKDEKFVYDDLGNPTTYRNKTLTWSHGRQLDKFGDIAQYSYNASGIRTKKTVNTSTGSYDTYFILNDNKILKQIDPCNELTFYYGADGVTGFHIKSTNATYKGQPLDHDFYYKKNAQNDIIGIISSENETIVEYVYDAFGGIFVKNSDFCKKIPDFCKKFVDFDFKGNYTEDIGIELFIALKNPFLYRGYYYDFETNLYYLNSRYYDPEIGRFINADDISVLGSTKDVLNGLNLYAYCLNNPINSLDDNGNIPNWLKWLIGGLIIVAALALTIVSAGVAGVGLGAAFAGVLGIGASVGGFTGFMAGVTVGATIGAAVGALSSGLSSFIQGGNFFDGAADGFMWGAASGAISGGFSTFKFGGFGDILNPYSSNVVGNKIHIIGQTFISVATYFGRATANNEPITLVDTLYSAFNGVVGGLMYNASFKTQIILTVLYEIGSIAITGLREYLKQRRVIKAKA